MHVTLVVDDVPFDVWLKRVEGRVEVEVEGDTFTFEGSRDGDAVALSEAKGTAARVVAPAIGRLIIDGAAADVRVARFEPGGGPGARAVAHGRVGPVRTPMTGKVLKVMRKAGATVVRGDVVVVLEAMKMQIDVVSPADGVVGDVRVKPGDAVDASAVLFDVGPPP